MARRAGSTGTGLGRPAIGDHRDQRRDPRRARLRRAVLFYRALGLELRYGGEAADCTSFHAGAGYLNLIAHPADRTWAWWGRIISHVADVDAFHVHVVAAGLRPDAEPRDAPWGERFFHITDPDGHELTFATTAPRRSGNL